MLWQRGWWGWRGDLAQISMMLLERRRGASEDKSVWIRAEANHRELMEGGLFYLNLRQNIINGPQLPQSVSTPLPLQPLYCDRILT